MRFFGGQLYSRSGCLDAQAVSRIVVVEITHVNSYYLLSIFKSTVQVAGLGDPSPSHSGTLERGAGGAVAPPAF